MCIVFFAKCCYVYSTIYRTDCVHHSRSKKWSNPLFHKVLDGSVDQSEQAFLTEEQIKEGYCLGTWMMADDSR